MSLQVLKKKGIVKYGAKISGKQEINNSLYSIPHKHLCFINTNTTNSYNGFSLHGNSRNKGRVGNDMKNSKVFTPYRGTYPVGYGKTYNGISIGSNINTNILGNTQTYFKSPVLTSKQRLNTLKKYDKSLYLTGKNTCVTCKDSINIKLYLIQENTG